MKPVAPVTAIFMGGSPSATAAYGTDCLYGTEPSSTAQGVVMTLGQRLSEYIRACFTGIWVQTHEDQDALSEIRELCKQESWRLATWDVDQGLSVGSRRADARTSGGDPLAAIRALGAIAQTEEPEQEKAAALLVLHNFHRFLQSAEIMQALVRQIVAGKDNRTFILILSPVVQIPVELEKLFVVLEHELPDRKQLEEIACGIATEDGEMPAGQELQTLLDAASGLTRYEAEGAFSLSLVRQQRLQADTVWELKCQTLKKSGLLQ